MISFSHINQLNSTQSVTPTVSVSTNISTDNSVEHSTDNDKTSSTTPSSSTENSNNKQFSNQLSESEQKQVDKLKQRDREVRAHEQAHAAAAGSLAIGGPKYELQTGPDGKRYAVGGSVNIDTSPVKGDPKATLDKAQKIQRAALAPAEPSQQDRAVAAEAAAMAAEARAELASQTHQLNTPGSSESQDNYCADCGGQHSSDSHVQSVQIDTTYHQSNSNKAESVFEIAA